MQQYVPAEGADQTLYVVLSRSHTIVARLVRMVTHKSYSHTSISLDKSVETLYSFGRKNPRFIFPAGFITEGWDKGFFKLFPNTMLIVMEVPVTQGQYSEVRRRLSDFVEHPARYKYAMANLWWQFVGKPVRREHHYLCSTFVAYLLEEVLPFDKDISLVYPYDFRLMGLREIYEGKASGYGEFYKNHRG